MLHYTAYTLGLSAVWSLWGNLGMVRCGEMSTLPARYILPGNVTSASSSGVSLIHQNM